jgi:hypothetical protein
VSKTTPVLAWGWYGLTPTILPVKSKSTKSTKKIDIVHMVYKHLAKHPNTSIARVIPGKILDKFISWFDLKQKALASPLTPSAALDDHSTVSPFIYAPEINYAKEDIQSFA